MKIYPHHNITCYFGSALTSFEPAVLKHNVLHDNDGGPLYKRPPFNSVSVAGMHDLVFINQVHGVQGIAIQKGAGLPMSFQQEGDYLCTSQPGIGLAVATADCLPIIIYSTNPCVVAIIHAGWRGTVNAIVHKVVGYLISHYRCSFEYMYVLLGPYAQVCCYQVGAEVLDAAAVYPYAAQKGVIKREQNYFFDTGLYNEALLIKEGVRKKHIIKNYVTCTMCSSLYCSFRRDKTVLRQFSFVCINA